MEYGGSGNFMVKNQSSVVICEKPSQARNLRAALGTTYGRILAARGHLLTLKEPQEVNPNWQKWSTDILLPDKPYGKKPVNGATGNLREIGDALNSAGRLIIATDCDREGLVIGRELADHLNFRGEILRAVFGAEDRKTLIDAFNRLVPITEFDGLYAAGRAREQADQIFNLSLTRTVTVHLGGHGRAIGIGRVRTPTLGIICQREREIEEFVPTSYHVVEATCNHEKGDFVAIYTQPRRDAPGTDPKPDDAPEEGREEENNEGETPGSRIANRQVAEAIARGVRGWEGPVKVNRKPVRYAPPRPFDLSSLQGHMGSRFKWPAKQTLDVAQTLYEDLKLITYPRAECRYLPENQVADARPLREALLKLDELALPGNIPLEPVIRQGRGKGNHYSDAGMGDSSHHAIQPNVRVVADLKSLWQRCDSKQKLLAKTIFLAFLEQTSADALLEQTQITFSVAADRVGLEREALFQAKGMVVQKPGWKAVRNKPDKRDLQILPPIDSGSNIRVTESGVKDKKTKPPGRFSEGGIIIAMRDAWKYIPDTTDMKGLRERLKDSSGIGTPATRDAIIESLVAQGQIRREEGSFSPTLAGMTLWKQLKQVAPGLVDPGLTALWEYRLDGISKNPRANSIWWNEVGQIAETASKARNAILTLREGGLKDAFVATLGEKSRAPKKRIKRAFTSNYKGRGKNVRRYETGSR